MMPPLLDDDILIEYTRLSHGSKRRKGGGVREDTINILKAYYIYIYIYSIVRCEEDEDDEALPNGLSKSWSRRRRNLKSTWVWKHARQIRHAA